MKVSKCKLYIVYNSMFAWRGFGCTCATCFSSDRLELKYFKYESSHMVFQFSTSLCICFYFILASRCMSLCAYKSCMVSSLMKAKATWLIVVAMYNNGRLTFHWRLAWTSRSLQKILTGPKYYIHYQKLEVSKCNCTSNYRQYLTLSCKVHLGKTYLLWL